MKRSLAGILVVILCLGLFSLQGCGESEQAKLEAEKTRLEIEKLKREEEQEKERQKINKEIFSTDKLKNFKPSVKF